MLYLKLDVNKVNWRAFLWLCVYEQAHILKAKNLLNSLFEYDMKINQKYWRIWKNEKCIYYNVNPVPTASTKYMYAYIYMHTYM